MTFDGVISQGRFGIPYNESAEAHVKYVWKAVCKDLPAKHFILVAHSYGGVSTLNILEHHGYTLISICELEYRKPGSCLKCEF